MNDIENLLPALLAILPLFKRWQAIEQPIRITIGKLAPSLTMNWLQVTSGTQVNFGMEARAPVLSAPQFFRTQLNTENSI